MQALLDAMIAQATRHVETYATILPQVRIRVRTRQTTPDTAVYTPMVSLVLQGAKKLMIGNEVIRYDPASYFITAVDLPGQGFVMEASAQAPYISVSLMFDPGQLATLLPDLPPPAERPAPGYGVAPLTTAMLDPWHRLLRLLDEPEDVPALAPLCEREILYRLLREPHGMALRQLARDDSRLSRIRRTIGWIRRHYDQPLRIEHLAEMAGMSIASLHRHFKIATGNSPLQYQKSLRLQQARRRLLAREDATRVGYAVGYESLSQFSREYARMFGEPPLRDARRLLHAQERAS